MKRFLYEYGWVFIILFFMGVLAAAYKIVDQPDQVSGATNKNKYDVPENIAKAAEKYGNEYGISVEFIEAVCWVESNYNPNISNASGTCHGLMQISYSAHGSRMAKLGVSNIFDVDGNIHVGCDYLAELFEAYEDPSVVLAIYNGQSQAKVNAAMYDGYVSEYAEAVTVLAYELEERNGKHSPARFDPATANWEAAVG